MPPWPGRISEASLTRAWRLSMDSNRSPKSPTKARSKASKTSPVRPIEGKAQRPAAAPTTTTAQYTWRVVDGEMGAYAQADCDYYLPGTTWDGASSCYTDYVRHAVELVDDGIGNELDVGFTLTDADGFDEDDVVRGGEHVDHGVGGACETAEIPARRH